MPSRTKTVTKNTLWSALDLALDFTLPIITSVMVARAMGPSKLGAYGYILWVTQMALIVGSIGIPRAAARYLAEHLTRGEGAEATGVLKLTLQLQMASASFLVLLGLGWVFVRVPAHDRTYAILAILSILPVALMGMASAVNSAREDFGANVLSSSAGVVTQAGGVILTLIFGWDLPGLAASLLLGRTIDCVVRWGIMRARTPPDSTLLRFRGASLSPDRRREVLLFCRQTIVLLLVDLVAWNRSEMFFLRRFCGLQEIAFFSLAYTFATIPAQLATPFSGAAVASLFVEQGRSEVGARQVARLMARYVALVVFPAALGLAALSFPLVVTLYGQQYAAAAPVLTLAALFAFAAPFAEPATSLTTVAGGQGTLVRWAVITAGLTLGLDLWLVRWQCAAGGAVANGCGQLLSTVGIWTIATRRFGLHLDAPFLRSVGFAAGLVGAGAAVAARLVPSVAALIVVPPLGVLAYVLLLKRLRVLDADDARRLSSAAQVLPRVMQGACDRVIGWLATSQPTAARGEA